MFSKSKHEGLINLISFILLVIAPLVFFVSNTGLHMRQNGYGWIPFLTAIPQAALFALIVSGLPGKKVTGSDDAGFFVGRFWGVFIFLGLALIGIAFILKSDA